MKLGEVVVHIDRVLQLHQVSLHFDEKNNTFISNTFNGWSAQMVSPLGAGELGLKELLE